MNIQEIDILLNMFNEKASSVREQLTTLLVTVSDGRVPTEDLMSAFDADVMDLREKYNGIYSAARQIAAEDELPEKGMNISSYVDAAKNSRFRLLKEQVEEAKSVLEKFISIKSKLDHFANALKPYQDAAAELVSQLNEETVQEILPKTEASKIFIETMEFEDKSSAEGLTLLRAASQYYPFEIQMGLATNQYYVGKNDTGDMSVIAGDATDSNDNDAEATSDVPDCIVTESEGDATETLVAEASVINETEAQEEIVDSNIVVVSDSEIKEEKCPEISLKAINKPKSGTPSASSFRKEIVKIGKINKEIRTVLPLFTNLGALTKEQCFLFSVCMDCNNENDQARESVNSAIDALVSKGYVACFDYENDGEKIAAYCLSDYCDSCLRKDSISSQMKGFWSLSFGNYRFHTNGNIERDTLHKAISNNAALLRYVYSVKETLSEEDFSVVKRSITWKEDHYQVAVIFDHEVYSCCLAIDISEIENIADKSILLCAEEIDKEDTSNVIAESIFVFEKGSICRIGDTVISDDEIIPVEIDEESIDFDEEQIVGEVLSSEEEESPALSILDEVETEVHEEIMVSETDAVEINHTATTPLELLQKTEAPSDEEFCNIIYGLLNTEATVQDQLRTAIINSALLAYGAELEGKYVRSSELSQQLRLATNTFIEASAYTSENLATAFPYINHENASLALAAYMFAMLVPAMPFDYGLANQTEMVFREYEDNFADLDAFKALFNKLMFVKNASPTGFSLTSIALLGSNEKSEDFIAELKKQAEQYLTVQTPKTRMRQLPILYSDCFGPGSDLYECMSIIAQNNIESLDYVQVILSEFCDVQNDVYVLNGSKMEECLDLKWTAKNDFKLAYDAYGQALKQFKVRLEVMKGWSDIISQSNSSNKELSRLKKLKTEILAIIQDVQKDNTWRHVKNANVLLWMLRYMQKYLSGELVKIEVYSDLLFTGAFGLDDDGIPIIDKSTAEIKFYEPWRNALRHITAEKKTAEDVKSEIRGDILEDTDEEAGLKDNLHQLLLLGRFLKSEDEDYLVSDEYVKEAIASADDRTTRFKEALELAYTYNQINETEKETILGIMVNYQKVFYEAMDFASWRRFLEALELQMQEYAAGRKKGLRAKLDARLLQNAQSTLLKEANRLLEEDKNFAVTEEYLTRFDSGETELEDEVILHDKDYFGEFLEADSFDEIMRICRQGKGRALKNFGWDYVERKLKDWTNKNKEDSKLMISSWPTRKDAVSPSQIQTLFKCLGFNVTGAVRKAGYKEDLFTVSVVPTAKSMADYRHPIASFGTQIKKTINVILVDANYTPRQLVDSVSSLDLGGISIVIYNQPMDASGRRMVGEIFHTQTSGQNPFLLLDQVLFLYLAMHQITERIPALLKCTLPYTTYQPFVRDGGSTADEMFCGRAQELATIIDPNGACVVYGGRQLGKTALLERAESRCSKPDNKEYAVYSTIIRIDNEKEVVDTLVVDIERKTNGKVAIPKCNTLKELCSYLSKMFRNGQIATMHLFIDEVDCFLAAIADKKYTPIQPLVDLKRETKNNFKFVLTGLHNVCRAKNATRDNGIFGQLGTPLCIKPLSPTDALKLLSRPLNYLGFQIDRYPHLETILTNTNYYPGILQFFGYMLVETLTGQYAKYYSATDGNPPFSLQDEQLGAVMNSADLNKSIKDKFRWSLELDERYFMIARCITMLYHLNEEERTAGTWMGFKVKDILEMSEEYDIHCLENESLDSFINLLDEMVEMGILSQPIAGCYRLRRSSFVDIIGENMDILDSDIVNNNEVTA